MIALWWLLVAVLWLVTGLVHDAFYAYASVPFFMLAAAIAIDDRRNR